MQQPSHAQMDDIQDAIDMAGLVEAALRVYPDLVAQAGVTSSALDAIGEIAFDRHQNESVARFRDNPGRFLRSDRWWILDRSRHRLLPFSWLHWMQLRRQDMLWTS